MEQLEFYLFSKRKSLNIQKETLQDKMKVDMTKTFGFGADKPTQQ